MAEPFNPNAFRQQMVGQGQDGLNPAHAPQQIPSPVPQTRVPTMPAPAAPAPYPSAPQQAGQQAQPYMPQAPQPPIPPQVPQHVPQAPMHNSQQPYAPQPAQPAHPQMHPQQGAGQQRYQQPVQGYMPGQQLQGYTEMPQEPVQEPAKKGGLFKRKKLKTAIYDMAPSQNDMLQNALPAAENSGLSRFIVFAGGLALGVFGTLIGIMLFSPSEPQRASIAANPASASVLDDSQRALTDKMLIENKKQG